MSNTGNNIADVAVIGGGAAGCMAAIRASEFGRSVLLLEKNESIGKKIMITGNGRCNLTNSLPIDGFIEKFGQGGEFYRTAFYAFSNEDLISFFRAKGLEMVPEKYGKIYPSTGKAMSVVNVLEQCLNDGGVSLHKNTSIADIVPEKGFFRVVAKDGREFPAKKVVLAAGGASYKSTGSTGDGYEIARRLGHTVEPISPALVPLTVKEEWIKNLQGISLENTAISFVSEKKKVVSGPGEIMFTHYGLSGPLVLDMSSDILSGLAKQDEIRVFIDVSQGASRDELEKHLLDVFASGGSQIIKSVLENMVPKRMAGSILALTGIKPEKKANQIDKTERLALVEAIKAFPVTVNGSLPLEAAMVTAGGVSKKEIDPRSMGSKIVPGLYFAGEIIEGAAPSGGFNLQKAFSTGYLAGEKAG